MKWLPFAEWWYNTSYHIAIHATLYSIVYNQSAPTHLPYLVGNSKVEAVDRTLQAREATLRMLKIYLQRAQNRLKQQADKHRSNRQFEVGELVYVKLQPYCQTTIAHRKCLELSAIFFGPYKILEKVREVAYKLELPARVRVHLVFHVSQLKKHVRLDQAQSQLPLLDETG